MSVDATAEVAYFKALLQSISKQSPRTLDTNLETAIGDLALYGNIDSTQSIQRIASIEDAIRQMQMQISQLLQREGSLGHEALQTHPKNAKPPLANTIEDKLTQLQSSYDDLATKVVEMMPRLENLEMKESSGQDAIHGQDAKTGPIADFELEGEDDDVAQEEQDHKASSGEHAVVLAKLEEHVYQCSESIWDVSVFAGLPAFGPGVTCIVLVVLLVLVMMVVVFTGIIIVNFADADNYSNTVKSQLEAWRNDVGHLLKYSDTATGTAMTARICAQDAGLEGSYNQFNYVGNLQAYLPSDSCDTFSCHIQNALFAGPKLSVMAIAVWHMTCWAEIMKALFMCRAICKFETAARTQVSTNSKEKIHIKALSRSRKVFGLSIALMKLSLIVILMIAGTSFLIHTVNLQNLLLNALALEFVLHLDGLVYDALAPARVRTFVEHCEGFPLGRMPSIGGADAWSLVALPLTLIGICIAHFFFLAPFVDRLFSLLDIVCAGDVDFVVQQDAVGMMWAVKTPKFGAELSPNEKWRLTAVKDAIENYDHARAKGVIASFDSHSSSRPRNYNALLQTSDMSSFNDRSHYNPTHINRRAGLSGDIANAAYLNFLTGNSSVTCDNLAKVRRSDIPSCYLNFVPDRNPEFGPSAQQAVRIRSICKHGCGCLSPFWGTIFKDYGGCPGVEHTPAFLDDLAQLNCSDIGTKDEHIWTVYWFQNYFMPNPELDTGVNWPDPFAANSTFCTLAHEQFGKLITSWPAVCPVTWGCTSGKFLNPGNRKYCPSACPCQLASCTPAAILPIVDGFLRPEDIEKKLHSASNYSHDTQADNYPDTR